MPSLEPGPLPAIVLILLGLFKLSQLGSIVPDFTLQTKLLLFLSVAISV